MSGQPRDSTQRCFFELPAEVRLLVYERYCDVMQQDLLEASTNPCNARRAGRRHSYGETLHLLDFKRQTENEPRAQHVEPAGPNAAYENFVQMKLVCRQMRAEFVPTWCRHWIFELPCPQGQYGKDSDPGGNFENSLAQLQGLAAIMGPSSKYIKRLRLTHRLREQEEPERAVAGQEAEELVEMLGMSREDFHPQLFLGVQVHCRDVRSSKRMASKDILFRRQDMDWHCICDGPTTISYSRLRA